MLIASLLAGCASQTTVKRRLSVAAPTATVITNMPLPARVRELLLNALSQIGVPYQNGGRSPNTGFDCSGLVHYAALAAGLLLPRDAAAMSQVGSEVAMNDLQAGDLVFFNTLGRPYSHVGIYLGEQRFVHAPTRGGYVSVVDMRMPYWQQRFDGGRRLDL